MCRNFIPDLILMLSMFLLWSCDKENQTNGNEDLIISNRWKVYEYHNNGVPDPSIVAQQHIYELRTDGRLYFEQIGPVHRDTFQYQFISPNTIKITKPSASATAVISLQIDRITSSDFDFTLTNNENTDVDTYKTLKQ